MICDSKFSMAMAALYAIFMHCRGFGSCHCDCAALKCVAGPVYWPHCHDFFIFFFIFLLDSGGWGGGGLPAIICDCLPC